MSRRPQWTRLVSVACAAVLVLSITMPAAAQEPQVAPSPQPSSSVHPDPRNVKSEASGSAGKTQTAAAASNSGFPSAFLTTPLLTLGVNPEAHLNAPGGPPSSGTRTTYVGLRYRPTNADAIAPGCQCEGWGIADRLGNVSGWASIDNNGISPSLVVTNFATQGVDTAISTVEIHNAQGAPVFRVVHAFTPSPATPNLFAVGVTIQNTSGAPVDAVYRRVMDWDVEPTAFNEYVTLVGDSNQEPWLETMTNDGFANPDPLVAATDRGTRGPAQDVGPFDHGALFDLHFGQLDPGRSVNFIIYYGAAANETDALAALSAVHPQAYSLGEPATDPVNGTPNTFMFGFARPQDCDEVLTGSNPTPAGTRVGLPHVTVNYDPRTLADPRLPNAAAANVEIARLVRERAEAALDRYASQGFAVSQDVTVDITCNMFVGVPFLPTGAPAVTEADNHYKLRASWLRDTFHDVVATWDPATQPNLPIPHNGWQITVDHETFHTIQAKSVNILGTSVRQGWNYEVGHDYTNTESSAVLASDLFPDWDDSLGSDYLGVTDRLLRERKPDNLVEKSAIDTDIRDFPTRDAGYQPQYQAASIFQYWAEQQFANADLEQRTVRFLQGMVAQPGRGPLRLDAQAAVLGRDVFDALREFFIAAWARGATNVPAKYKFLDETTKADGSPLTPSQYPTYLVDAPFVGTLGATPLNFPSLQLEHAQAAIYNVTIPAGTAAVDVTVNAASSSTQTKLAFLPYTAFGDGTPATLAIRDAMLPAGPIPGTTTTTYVATTGFDHVAVIVLATGADASFTVSVARADQSPTVALQTPPTGWPIVLGPGANSYFTLRVNPRVGGQIHSDWTASNFSVRIDGVLASVQPITFQADHYDVPVLSLTSLASGNHDIRVDFQGVFTTRTAGLQIASAQPAPPPETTSTGSLGSLGQGQTASTSTSILASSQAADFTLAWAGSNFDLTLTSPTGRVITETTVASDVVVTQGANTVTIRVVHPTAGTWRVDALGVTVPSPELVTYAVRESDSAVHSELTLRSAGRAGTPFDLSVGLGGPAGPILGATVSAVITDPAGVVRRFALSDQGGGQDGGTADGLYGGRVWGSDLTGSYSIRVVASGLVGTAPFSREETTTIVLAARTDADADGLDDSIEPLFGLSPSNPADAAVDVDQDGLQLRAELAAGTDPMSGDTDRGGESDATEASSGRDPRSSADDRVLPVMFFSATALDGGRVSLSAATVAGAGTVSLVRVGPGGAVALGTLTTDGTERIDVPPTAGTYTYWATVSAAGAAAPPQSAAVTVATDVIAPDGELVLNAGAWFTTNRYVTVVFGNLSEPATSMRLAESEAALATTAWQAFTASSTFHLGPTVGTHRIYAQVRDAAGLASRIMVAPIDLTMNDEVAPQSTAVALPAAVKATALNVPYTASDDQVGVAAVELWMRFRSTPTGPWSAYSFVNSATSAPIAITLGLGDGDYEFYTIAQDRNGNREAQPAFADAHTTLDRLAPTSSVSPLPAQTSGSPAPVAFTTSDDRSGVASSELWYRFRAIATDPWDSWTLGPTATTSPFSFTFPSGSGFYEFYSIALDVAGNREAAPAAADATTQRLSGDTTPPVSAAGALAATYTGSSVSVPYTASDNASGVASVELWARYRPNEALAWGTWAKALTGTVSPFTYSFANGDGNYEFYTIAVDGAGNRESVPATADTATRRDAVDDPPDFSVGALGATGPCTVPPCPLASTTGHVVLWGNGSAADDRSTVTVSWQLWGVKSNGQRQKAFSFKSATPDDGTFNSRIESFSLSDDRSDAGYVYYDVDIKVSAGGVSTTRTVRVFICRPSSC